MKIECKICKMRITGETLLEHYKKHHPAEYQHVENVNEIANRELKNYKRKGN